MPPIQQNDTRHYTPAWRFEALGSRPCGEHRMTVTTEREIVEMPQLAAQWARIRGRLQTEVGDVEYRTWLRQMTLSGLDGDEVTITLPTRFMRDWVRSHYADRLTALWHTENPAIRRVDIRVGNSVSPISGMQDGLAESLAEPP